MGEKHSAVGYLFREGAFYQPKKQSRSAMSLAWTCFSIEAPFMKEKPDCNSVLSSRRRTWPVSLRSMAVLKKSKS